MSGNPKTQKTQKMQKSVRIGGKGTPRRKKKVVHKSGGNDDKRLFSTLKKLNANTIPGVEEANFIMEGGNVIHFDKPKVQAAVAANTFCVSGAAKNTNITELLPGILSQLGPESLEHIKTAAQSLGVDSSNAPPADDVDDDVDDDIPDLTAESFEDAAKN